MLALTRPRNRLPLELCVVCKLFSVGFSKSRDLALLFFLNPLVPSVPKNGTLVKSSVYIQRSKFLLTFCYLFIVSIVNNDLGYRVGYFE